MLAQNPQSTIFGKILDENKQPLEQVIININGKSNILSDVQGNFRAKIPSDERVVITFSLVGMKAQKITLNLAPKINF